MHSAHALISHLDQYHEAMISHIQFYTVGQYADFPEDEATAYTIADCIWQMRRYQRRHGTQRRAGQERLDMLKLGHYAAIAAAKIYDQDLDETGRVPGMSYRAHEWCVVYGWLREMLANNEMPGAMARPWEMPPAGLIDQIGKTLHWIDREAGNRLPLFLRVIFLAAAAWLKMPESRPESEVPFVRVKAMHPDAQMPQVKTDGAAGADLAAVESCTVASGQVALVRTGIAMEIPQGYEGQVRSRSGISTAKQLILLNGIGTIDADYRGEIMVPVKNIGRERQEIEAGDRIAQLMIRPAPKFAFCWADELESTERGVGGFGSTGVN